METGESMDGGRKRTESNGTGSDSDLSDGWNFVDQMDVNNHDPPSSDGESVEVIEADEESPEHGNGEVEEAEEMPLVARLECPVISSADSETDVSPEVEAPPPHEEMFDSSFCWFLFFAVSAVLISNLAFMAAENALDWNVNVDIDSPSFLRDLPTKPKSPQQDSFSNVMSWKTNEEITVESEDDTEIGDEVMKEKSHERSKRVMNGKIHQKHLGSRFQKSNVEIDKHEIDKYFKRLSEITDSPEAHNKFAQALLILDALHVGLKDLEDVVTENSELFQVLKTQKDKLNGAMNEIAFGVSRSMERLSSNILNKVKKLERKFENQWCKLEKNGHKEELESLFYDCQEIDAEHDVNEKDASKSTEFTLDNGVEKEVKEQHYHYQVDKDSTGKVYSKPESRNEKSEDYDNWVKNGKYIDTKYNKKHKNEKTDTNKDGKKHKFSGDRGDRSHKYKKEVDQDKVYETSKVNPTAQNVAHTKNQPKYEERFKNKKENRHDRVKHENSHRDRPENIRQSKNEKTSKDESDNKRYQSKHETPPVDRAAIESLGKYLKENCQRIIKDQKSKFANSYEKIKDKIRVTKELFDTMYEKYCRFNHNSFKWESKLKKENLKGDYSGKNNDKRNFIKNEPVIIEDSSSVGKDAIEFTVINMSEENNQGIDPPDSPKNPVIEPRNKPHQWMFSYESSSSKTNISGDWFIKVGESRSKVRWSHHRSDWLFDRASHRRNQPHPQSWLIGRRKNWFFRRAWARQQCRQNPHDTWCHVPQDETITIPNSGPNFR